MADPPAPRARTTTDRRQDWTRLLLPLSPSLPDTAAIGDLEAGEVRRTVDRMRPDGWLYIAEGSDSASLRDRLARLGLGRPQVFETWPPGERPKLWLPADQPGARSFAEATFGAHAGRGPLRRVRSLLRALRVQAPRLAASRVFVPLGATDARGGRLPLLQWAVESWAGWGLPPLAQDLSCLMVTDGYRDSNRCVILLFAEPSPEPVVAVKIPRSTAGDDLRREAEALRFLESRGHLEGAPRALWIGSLGGWPVLVQTAQSGRSLGAVLTVANARAIATGVTDWLASLAHRTARPEVGGRWQHQFGPAFDEMRTRLAAAGLTGVLDRGLPSGNVLDGVPTVLEHRDFAPWNLLLEKRGGISVLDWESSEVDGVPGLDLLYFLAYLAFVLDRVAFTEASPDLRAAYRRSLDPATATGAIRSDCLDRYSAAVGLPRERLERLGALAWAIHFASECRNFAADSSGVLEPHGLKKSVFLMLLEEDLRHRELTGSGS